MPSSRGKSQRRQGAPTPPTGQQEGNGHGSASSTATVPPFQFGSFRFIESPAPTPLFSSTSLATPQFLLHRGMGNSGGNIGEPLQTLRVSPTSSPTSVTANKTTSDIVIAPPKLIHPTLKTIPIACVTWVGEKISVDELFEMAVNNDTQKVLLIHCQEKYSLELATIKKFECFPIHNMVSFNDVVINQLTSKSEIVQFLCKHFASTLEVLNAPGFYKHVIVLDEESTCPVVKNKTAVIMLKIFSKWNENTRTKIRFLDGGFAGVVSNRPSLLDREQPSVISRMQFQSHVFELSDCIIPPFSEPRNNVRVPRAVMNKQPITSLPVYVHELKRATEMATNCLKYQRIIKSLKSIKMLVEHEEADIANAFVDNQIPEAVKCPVCTEIFTLEIFQCANGHSICSSCSGGLANCPVCRELYHQCKIRNRTLETLVVTAPNICCPFQSKGCQKKLKYNEVGSHLEECSFRQREALSQMEGSISTKENVVEIFKKELDIANKDLAQAESSLLWKKDTTNPSDSGESLKWMQIVLEWKRNFETMKVALATSLFMDNMPAHNSFTSS